MTDAAFPTPSLDLLRTRLGIECPNIHSAFERSADKRNSLAEIAIPSEGLQADTALVVFGSLARGEWTEGSDLDWVLLVDGTAALTHFHQMTDIRNRLQDARIIKPGTSGMFGGIVFSHELIHLIGGQDDTNRNLTLRMLLLLESMPVGGALVYNRVLATLLQRYLENASCFTNESTPRFLLNDLVRYWRTVAVDFADKYHDQEGRKAVLRNVKLRLSRKLIFASGLYACLDWQERKASGRERPLMEHFDQFARTPALEVLAAAALETGLAAEHARDFLESYDGFLGILSDGDRREHLETLQPTQAIDDSDFREARHLGKRFESALTELFFNEPLLKWVQRYGLF